MPCAPLGGVQGYADCRVQCDDSTAMLLVISESADGHEPLLDELHSLMFSGVATGSDAECVMSDADIIAAVYDGMEATLLKCLPLDTDDSGVQQSIDGVRTGGL